MKKVYASEDRLMVGHIKNLLEDQGFHCIIRNEHLQGVAGEIPPIECWPEIWVAEDSQYEEAGKMVEAALASPVTSGPTWKCHDCGEVLEHQFSECWNCGKSCEDKQD